MRAFDLFRNFFIQFDIYKKIRQFVVNHFLVRIFELISIF